MAATVLALNTLDADVPTIDCFAFPNPPRTISSFPRYEQHPIATMIARSSESRPQLPSFSFPRRIEAQEISAVPSHQNGMKSADSRPTHHRRRQAVSAATVNRHDQSFAPIPPISKHLLDTLLPASPRLSSSRPRPRPSPLKFELRDPLDQIAHSLIPSIPTNAPQLKDSLARRPTRPDLHRGISDDSAATTSSTAITSCPTLVPDDGLAVESQAPWPSSGSEDDASDSDAGDFLKDYETFRAITAEKLYGTVKPGLAYDDADDDDDDDGFWCKGPGSSMPRIAPYARTLVRDRDDSIEDWIKDCTKTSVWESVVSTTS